jgi:septum formation protein
LLTAAGILFVVRVADIDETPRPDESPREYVLRLADEKARAIPADADEFVLTADTTVVLDGRILGKPLDTADAARMLFGLSGNRHDVITGVCLMRGGRRLALSAAVTAVWFDPMTDSEIAEYAASEEPRDKAGAYAIQGTASRWISGIDGSYSNVVGLPIALVYRLLSESGWCA